MSVTANDLIQNALIELRVLAIGESVPSNRSSWALAKLNEMLTAWSLEGLMHTEVVEESYTLTVGWDDYTWGSAGEIVTDRPIDVLDSMYIRLNSVDYPVKKWSLRQHRASFDKVTQSRPTRFAYDRKYPLGRLYLYPTPDAAYSIYFASQKVFDTFHALTTSNSFAPGWERAIRYQLAIELAPGFGKTVSAELTALAGAAKGVIKTKNVKVEPKPLEVSALTNRR